eukprot:2091726-Pyramimonas_sp.AAC.1
MLEVQVVAARNSSSLPPAVPADEDAAEQIQQAKERAAQAEGESAEAARAALKEANKLLQSQIQAAAAKRPKRGQPRSR